MVHFVNSVVPGNMVPSSGTVVAVGLSTVHPKANHAVAFFATQVFASTAWCSATRRINWRTTSMIRSSKNKRIFTGLAKILEDLETNENRKNLLFPGNQ